MNSPSDRLTPLVLLCLTAFLFLFPLCVGKPGMPLTFKADEPAYFLMALSLARDGDLVLDVGDQRRAVDEFPHLPAQNTILMTDDGWRTLYYGKPYLYSLFAAPLTHWFGADGMTAFNMLLLMAMVWMGTSYLRSFNSEGLSALFATGYFIVSSTFAYVFWLHPEVFMATATCACLYFGLHQPSPTPKLGSWWARLSGFLRRPPVRLALSAAALAAGVYHKPMLAVLGVPVLWVLFGKRDWRGIATWLLAATIAMGAFAGFSYLMTGHPSAYLGVQRAGFKIDDPDVLPIQPQPLAQFEQNKTRNSWSWLWRLPDIRPAKTLSSLGSFLWGRHTGLLVYMPFAALAVLLFLIHGFRDAARWVLLGSTAALALFFLIWIPFNWHGGGGFVGNRYFVIAYPAFLFLVTRIRPAWSLVAAFAFGGAVLGVVVFQPLGSPVRDPTLQSHVRGRAFRLFPLEKTMQRQIPGYVGQTIEGVWFRGRKDSIELRGSEILFYGSLSTEMWMVSAQPIDEPVLFEVRTLAPDNEIKLSIGGATTRVVFEDADRPHEQIQVVELQPEDPELYRTVQIVPDDKAPGYLYHLEVEPLTGRRARNAAGKAIGGFYLGAGVRYLGTRRRVYDPASFSLEWSECVVPPIVTAGGTFQVTAALRNTSRVSWPRWGLTRVALSYHWQQDGASVVYDGARTQLPRALEAGASLETTIHVEAPAEPGTYELLLDPVREGIAWFSEHNGGAVCEATVEVAPA
ncbi:MAG: hypothetical protein O7A98_00790, partial [Acidobacteria bacterium]|nr:hypothetical protein [Acidobacteriota bacterium]